MRILYPCKIEKDKSDKFFVQFLDFEEAITEGDTLEEALFNASEVLTLTLEARDEEKMEIPLPYIKEVKGVYNISPSPRVQSALLFKFSRGDKTLANIARSLGTSWPAVSKLEDLHHWSSLKQLNKAASVLGKRVIIEFEDDIELLSQQDKSNKLAKRV